MKKLLLILLAVLLLAGCQNGGNTDEEKFRKEYGLKTNKQIYVRYAENEKDLLEQVCNGTHVILLAHPDESVNDFVSDLVDICGNFQGLYVYYYDLDKVTDGLAASLYEKATPYCDPGYLNDASMVIYLVKGGETVNYMTDSDMRSADPSFGDVLNDALTDMLNGPQPGCLEC